MNSKNSSPSPILFIGMCLLLPTKGITSNCPIIFLHGHEKSGKPYVPGDDGGWTTWNSPSHTAMMKIIADEYSGYTEGSPGDSKKPESNAKVIALEWLGGAAGATLASFLYKSEIEKLGWENFLAGPQIVFTWGGLNIAGAMGGVYISGKIMKQRGSFIGCSLGGAASLLCGFPYICKSHMSANSKIMCLGIVSGLGSTIGYNITQGRAK